MATNIPKSVDYSKIKPVGIPSNLRITKFQPQSAYGNLSSSDTVRFLINAPGYWDPYRTYMNINVDCSAMGTNHFQQLDSSAHSFFQELVIYSKGSEIERIMEYDTLACILNDVHYTPEQRQSRGHEGLGFTNRANPPADYGKAGGSNFFFDSGSANGQFGLYGSVGSRAIAKTNNVRQQRTINHSFSATGNLQINLYYLSQLPFNIGSWAIDNLIYPAVQIPPYAYCGIERADTVLLKNCSYTMHEVDNNINTRPVGSAATVVLETNHNEDACDVGCVNLFNYSLCGAAFEPKFSQSTQNVTSNGRLGQNIVVNTGTFSMPLISGLFGILMPAESFRLMPMAAFEDLILEFRLSRYAMFTSGYTDGGQVSDITATGVNLSLVPPFVLPQATMPQRTFAITKLEIVTELVEFSTPEIDVVVRSQLETGIIFHSHSWYNGPSFELANTAAATGTFQVNLGFESLKALMFCFLSSDYRQYTFCRKQYRLSRNITWMQIRIGIDYYPSQAIEGHAGNTFGTKSQGGTNEFIINLYKAFGKLHDAVTDQFVSVYNFPVNERPYNVADTRAFMQNVSPYSILNKSTCMGLPGYYENACVGKAVYGLNLESLNNDFQYISGVNTIKNRPFDINIKSDISNVNATLDRPATMMTFCLYDFLLEVTNTRIRVIGRG